MEFALWLIIGGCLSVGIAGSVASTWGLRRDLYRLKLDVVDIQNRILTENKRKAVDVRWSKDKLQAEADKLKEASGQPVMTGKNPWDLF